MPLSYEEKVDLVLLYHNMRKERIVFGVKSAKVTKRLLAQILSKTRDSLVQFDESLMKEARSFVSNVPRRTIVFSHFGPRIIRNVIPQELFTHLERYSDLCFRKLANNSDKIITVDDLIGETHSSTSGYCYNLHGSNSKYLKEFVELTKSVFKSVLEYESRYSPKCHYLREAFWKNKNSFPFDFNFVLYEKGKLQGVTKHVDSVSVMGVFVAVIEESPEGNLEVENLILNEDLRRSLVLLTPGTIHEVPIVCRSKRRSTIVITF